MAAGSKTAGRDRAARPQRSELSVPASSDRFFAKAAAGAADAVVLDLEDGVAEDRKDAARTAAIEAANTVDWDGKILSVRVNAIGTPWCHRDIVEVAAACPRLDRIVLPKAEEGIVNLSWPRARQRNFVPLWRLLGATSLRRCGRGRTRIAEIRSDNR